MKTLIIFILVQIFWSCDGYQTCSGRDISKERRFPMKKIQGLWYEHFTNDNTFFTNLVPTNGRFYFKTFGDNNLNFFYGRNKSSLNCADSIFLNRQRTHGSPCFLLNMISPVAEVGKPSEFIFSLLPGNDQLLLSFCHNPPYCSNHVAAVFTRRRQLCPGERELLLRKFRELRIPTTFKKQQRTKTSDCTFPGLENVKDSRSRSCYQVTREALRQLRRDQRQGQGR